MTSISSVLERIYKALYSAQQILNCPICLEKINNAAELPCGHIFCNLCIKNAIDTNPQKKPCPLCKKPFGRRDIDSATKEMKEYKDMLERLTAQLSLDLGFDITSYKSARTSTHEALSPVGKKLADKDAVKEISEVKDHDSEKSCEPLTRNSAMKSKGSLEPVKNISAVTKLPHSTPDVMVKCNKVGTGRNLTMEQCSEEDLDIFVPKIVKTDTRSHKQIFKKNVAIDDSTKSTKRLTVKKRDHRNDSTADRNEKQKDITDEGTPLSKKIRSPSRNRKKRIDFTKPQLGSNERDGIHLNASEKVKKYRLCSEKPEISKSDESCDASEQNLSNGNSNLSKQKEHLNINNEMNVNGGSISKNVKHFDGLEAKVRYERMSKVVKDLEDEMKSCKEEEVVGESSNGELNSSKKITKISKPVKCKNIELSVNKADKNKLQDVNSCRKNTLRSKKDRGNYDEGEGTSYKQDLIEKKEIDSYKETIDRSKRDRRSIQEEFCNKNDVKDKCCDRKLKEKLNKKSKIENKAGTSKHQGELDDRSSGCKGKEIEKFVQNKVEDGKEKVNTDFIGRNEEDECDEEIQKEQTEKAVEERNSNVGSKKRKRADTKALNLNDVTDLGSLVPQSPPKKQLCTDVGTQTTPSRLRPLLLEMKEMFTANDTMENSVSPDKTVVNILKTFELSNPISTEFLDKKKTPLTTLKAGHNHSTPLPDVKIVDTIDDDISMLPTQKNPKVAGFKSRACSERKSRDLLIGNLKTPLIKKLSTPGSSAGRFTAISSITTSEKRRINDSKFLNDSSGFPGDSLLENSELSTSILQNDEQNIELFTELIENTPQTVQKKAKRISRRLLEFYEGNSNSGDMFGTNKDEEILGILPISTVPLAESETCGECPATLDLNKGKEMEVDQVLFSQKSDLGSESSSKENKKPECANELDLFSDVKPVSTNGSILGDKSLLKNSLSQSVLQKPSCSGILSFANNKLQTPNSIRTAEELIEDSEDEEENCMIEATPEKLSQPMIQSLASTASGESKSCEPKDFCFVTSSLLASQLRCVKILAEVLECRINNSVTHETSHLIVQTCVNGRAKRTLKYLQAIALHKVVVSYTWVTSCLEEKALLAVEPYIVCDTWGAPAVYRSLNNCGNFLLKNFAIAIVEPTIDLTTPQVDELLDACGAIVIKDPRCFNFVPTNLLRVILTDQEDVQEEAIGWLKKFKAVTVRVDWLVSSIAQYNVSPLISYLQIPLESDILLRLGFPRELTEEEEDGSGVAD